MSTRAASLLSTGCIVASSVREVEFEPGIDVGCSMEITSSVLYPSMDEMDCQARRGHEDEVGKEYVGGICGR